MAVGHIQQRRRIVKLMEAAEISQREAARALGVNQSTVARDLDASASSDGNSAAEIEALEAGFDADASPRPPTPKPNGAHVANNSGDNEWYTPQEYIEAAREVMGATAWP